MLRLILVALFGLFFSWQAVAGGLACDPAATESFSIYRNQARTFFLATLVIPQGPGQAGAKRDMDHARPGQAARSIQGPEVAPVEVALQVHYPSGQAWLTSSGTDGCAVLRLREFRPRYPDQGFSVLDVIKGVERPDCNALENCASLSTQIRGAIILGEQVFCIGLINIPAGWIFMKNGTTTERPMLYLGTGRNNLAGWVFTKSRQGQGRGIIYANDGTAVLRMKLMNIRVTPPSEVRTVGG